VADGAGGFALDEYGIAVAVFPDLAHLDDVPRRFAFVPEFLAAAAVEPGFAAGQGAAEGFGVHVGEHEDFARVGVLGDGGDEAVFIEFDVFH